MSQSTHHATHGDAHSAEPTANPYRQFPIPADVEDVSEWNDAAPTPYRILHGPLRGVEGHELVLQP
jgi:hypothetical protein